MKYPLAQYRVSEDNKSIEFSCGVVSHNPLDIKNRYCAKCHRFVGDLWRPGDDPKKFWHPRTE